MHKAGARPRETHSLATVRTMASTGSPLVPESFDYVYADIKPDIHLASISGGTDLVSCFALGNPVAPVYRGELQTRGLALAVDVFDDDGKPIRGEKGELVCTKPFPPMPLGFWGDSDGSRYHGAYFDRFPNIWCHGDFVELTERGGLIIYGRSDATLNPGGCSHRDRRDLSPGRAVGGSRREHRVRPVLGQRHAGGAVRPAARRRQSR